MKACSFDCISLIEIAWGQDFSQALLTKEDNLFKCKDSLDTLCPYMIVPYSNVSDKINNAPSRRLWRYWMWLLKRSKYLSKTNVAGEEPQMFIKSRTGTDQASSHIIRIHFNFRTWFKRKERLKNIIVSTPTFYTHPQSVLLGRRNITRGIAVTQEHISSMRWRRHHNFIGSE